MIAVYGAGYARTQSAADGFAKQLAVRRVALPLPGINVTLDRNNVFHPRVETFQMAGLRFTLSQSLAPQLFPRRSPVAAKAAPPDPIVLSTNEVRRLIDAAPNLRYRTILMTLYDTGMRRAELCQLRPQHIDNERMIVRIPHGKGGKAP